MAIHLRFIWFWAKFSADFGTICMLWCKFSLLKMAKYWKHNLVVWWFQESFVRLLLFIRRYHTLRECHDHWFKIRFRNKNLWLNKVPPSYTVYIFSDGYDRSVIYRYIAKLTKFNKLCPPQKSPTWGFMTSVVSL